ncbi:outer membrane protein [Aliiroseovarius sp. PTFE2010]|uniref:outer membrane protein n=1 Tax=Aliiroseovarius sp. PTFE2010 TaxID=3417190 RepID=UPI003CECBA06
MSSIRSVSVALGLFAGLASPAFAEVELSFYGGYQTAPHSDVTGNDPENGGAQDFTAGWEGKSFSPPPYYGIRATWWRTPTFGYGVEFTHAKVYADSDTLAANSYERFEMTDGLNLITVNATRRWPEQWGDFTPYVSGGLGLAIPHVDIRATGGSHTFGYQATGPALRLTAGVSYQINDRWSAFGEYQGSYSMHTIDLDNGGELKTDIVTNSLNIGVSYGF